MAERNADNDAQRDPDAEVTFKRAKNSAGMRRFRAINDRFTH
jgi:hypothetical protein